MKEDVETMNKLKQHIVKLRSQVENLTLENKKLKSENKTYKKAWRSTECFLQDISDGRSVEEMISAATKGKMFKESLGCSKCSASTTTLKLGHVTILNCSNKNCNHKECVNESSQEN